MLNLCAGKIEPRSLDTDQIRRLTRFVDQMVTTLVQQRPAEDDALTDGMFPLCRCLSMSHVASVCRWVRSEARGISN